MGENLGSQNMNVSTKSREGGCVVQGHGGFIPVPRFQPCWTGVAGPILPFGGKPARMSLIILGVIKLSHHGFSCRSHMAF